MIVEAHLNLKRLRTETLEQASGELVEVPCVGVALPYRIPQNHLVIFDKGTSDKTGELLEAYLAEEPDEKELAAQYPNASPERRKALAAAKKVDWDRLQILLADGKTGKQKTLLDEKAPTVFDGNRLSREEIALNELQRFLENSIDNSRPNIGSPRGAGDFQEARSRKAFKDAMSEIFGIFPYAVPGAAIKVFDPTSAAGVKTLKERALKLISGTGIHEGKKALTAGDDSSMLFDDSVLLDVINDSEKELLSIYLPALTASVGRLNFFTDLDEWNKACELEYKTHFLPALEEEGRMQEYKKALTAYAQKMSELPADRKMLKPLVEGEMSKPSVEGEMLKPSVEGEMSKPSVEGEMSELSKEREKQREAAADAFIRAVGPADISPDQAKDLRDAYAEHLDRFLERLNRANCGKVNYRDKKDNEAVRLFVRATKSLNPTFEASVRKYGQIPQEEERINDLEQEPGGLPTTVTDEVLADICLLLTPEARSIPFSLPPGVELDHDRRERVVITRGSGHFVNQCAIRMDFTAEGDVRAFWDEDGAGGVIHPIRLEIQPFASKNDSYKRPRFTGSQKHTVQYQAKYSLAPRALEISDARFLTRCEVDPRASKLTNDEEKKAVPNLLLDSPRQQKEKGAFPVPRARSVAGLLSFESPADGGNDAAGDGDVKYEGDA